MEHVRLKQSQLAMGGHVNPRPESVPRHVIKDVSVLVNQIHAPAAFDANSAAKDIHDPR